MWTVRSSPPQPSPGEGDKGIDTLLRQGRMIQATQRDLDEYMSRIRGVPRPFGDPGHSAILEYPPVK